jgi:hypothetical protein
LQIADFDQDIAMGTIRRLKLNKLTWNYTRCDRLNAHLSKLGERGVIGSGDHSTGMKIEELLRYTCLLKHSPLDGSGFSVYAIREPRPPIGQGCGMNLMRCRSLP